MEIAELFARDPLLLTRDDLTHIVEQMRKSRHAFNNGNAKAGSTKPKTAKQKAIASLSEKLDITI